MSDVAMTSFYIVRHGESEHNANFEKSLDWHNQWGELEAPLTATGRKQAQQRRDAFKHMHFDAVFSSDLARAQQTAEIIVLEKNLAVQTTKLIRERMYLGYLRSLKKPFEEILQEVRRDLQTLDEKGKMAYKYGDGMESAEEGVARLITFLRETAIAYPGKTVLVVCHGNLIRSFLVHLGFAAFDELPTGSVTNTGYAIVETDGIEFSVKKTEGITKNTEATQKL